ncbi:hypothetical protein M2347_003811 [Chryseobacterium sp. H1D6B]|nr:hypothetical protein [Chryseobacterium sp. H1D6B]
MGDYPYLRWMWFSILKTVSDLTETVYIIKMMNFIGQIIF